MQEALRTPSKINRERPTNRRIKVKMLKVNDEEKIFKRIKRKNDESLTR